MCRAQFELDDIAEADIVCQRGFRPPSCELETDPDKSVPGSIIHDEDGTVNRLNSKPSVLHWKLPAWINFSYSIPEEAPDPKVAILTLLDRSGRNICLFLYHNLVKFMYRNASRHRKDLQASLILPTKDFPGASI